MATTKKMTPAEDRAADKKAGIKPGSARDNALDRKRGVPVGKGQGGPMPGMPPGPAVTPPAGAAAGPPMPSMPPLPPGVRAPRPKRRGRAAGPVARPPMARPPMAPPGVGGGKGKGTQVAGSGQRDPKGNYRPGVNSKGKKVGSGSGGKNC